MFVKNVDFSINDEQLTEHFKECGEIERVTIRKNPSTGQSLGICYIQFLSKDSAIKARLLNESVLKGRQITVMPKRKNVPGRGRGQFGGRGTRAMAMMQRILGGMMRGIGMRGFGRGMGRGGYRGRGRGGPPGMDRQNAGVNGQQDVGD